MKKTIAFILALVLCVTLCACGSQSDVEESTHATEATETTAPPIDRLTKTEAKSVFDAAYDDFVELINGMQATLAYWNDNDFETLDDIYAYEDMWQAQADAAKAIQDALLEKMPPKTYEKDWMQFAEYMGEVSAALAKGSNMNPDGDNQYTGDEMANLIREISQEFLDICYPAEELATEIKEGLNATTTTTPNADSGHTCTECGKNASRSYANPFSGKTEYYCETHYQEILDIMGEMEEDVGNSNQSKHTCEECSREGTHRYESFTGQIEYYCTEHYEELMDLLDSLGLG